MSRKSCLRQKFKLTRRSSLTSICATITHRAVTHRIKWWKGFSASNALDFTFLIMINHQTIGFYRYFSRNYIGMERIFVSLVFSTKGAKRPRYFFACLNKKIISYSSCRIFTKINSFWLAEIRFGLIGLV